MDLADPAGLLINGADFAADHKADGGNLLPGGSLEAQGQGQAGLQDVGPGRHRLQFGGHLPEPFRVGAIAGAHYLHALIAAPEVQMLQVGLLAGGNGIAGMDMQVGDGFHEFFTLPQIRARYHQPARVKTPGESEAAAGS